MTNEEKYRSIALELLDKYVEAEQTVIGEYSSDFKTSSSLLESKIVKYLEELNAEDHLDEIKADRWIFEIEEIADEEN